MRVLHLPKSVGGNAWILSQAERDCGIQSAVMVTSTSIYNENYDIYLDLEKKKIGKLFLIAKFYLSVIRKYDIFHFNFGESLLSGTRYRLFKGLDLKVLKAFNKVVFVTYQGSDARQAWYCLDNQKINYFVPSDRETNRFFDFEKAKCIRLFDKYADKIYTTNPDLLGVLPKRAIFRPYTKINILNYIPSFSDYSKEVLTIVHAPTDRIKKGTSIVLKVVNQLICENFPIRLQLIEKMANFEALECYKNADIIIDQLLIGWYGGVAVECMAMGKPVFVYLRDEDLECLPKEMVEDMPFIRVTPDSLYEELKWYLNNRNILKQIAIKSRDYVTKWHDSLVIAENIIRDYDEILSVKREKKRNK